eukprot:s3316_g2.t1
MAISRDAPIMAALGAAAVVGLGSEAFVASKPLQAGSAPSTSSLRGATAVPGSGSFGGASRTLAVGAGAVATAVLGRGALLRRRATAVKKKGVRVVEGKDIPWNLFSPKAPYEGSCVSKETITSKTPLVNWETCHVIMDHGGKVPYIEGQSIGVIAPGPDKKGETPAKIRLYSIASSAPDDVLITGPTGAEMLLPEDPEANMIFMATGTGIAPFRSHLRNLFHDKVSKGKFNGCAWLFLGVPYSESLLYDEEWKEMQAEFPGQFRYDYAVSSEEKSEKNKINGEMWVQHKMMEYGEDLWELVKDPKTHIYMCGLKGMESGFAECFQEKVEAEGMVYAEFLKKMKKDKRYHVEVY